MRAGIDKVDAYFEEEVSVKELEQRADELGLKHARVRIGNNKAHALRVGDPDGEHIHLQLTYQSSTHGKKLISNLNHFKSFARYKDFLILLFGRNGFEFLTIYRIDFCVDLKESFHNLKRWFRVPYKQHSRHDTNKGRTRTGITFGKEPHTVCLYDKTEEQRLKGIETDGSVTRVEARFFGEKKPVEFVKDLPEILSRNSKGEFFEPFKSVSIEPIQLVPIESVTSREKLIKWVRLDTLLNVGGYDLAYKELNTNGNFGRDIKGIATFSDYPHDLDAILVEHLEHFFGRKRKKSRYDF